MNTIILILVGVVAVGVVSFLVKSFMKFVIIGAIIYGLFHLGFIWGVDDLNNKLHLSKFFNQEANESIQNAYSDYTAKRDEKSVVNAQEIKKVVDETIQKAVSEAKAKATSVDREAIMNELEEKLRAYGTAVVEQAKKDFPEVMKEQEQGEQPATNQP